MNVYLTEEETEFLAFQLTCLRDSLNTDPSGMVEDQVISMKYSLLCANVIRKLSTDQNGASE
jgi:hypothetical protein